MELKQFVCVSNLHFFLYMYMYMLELYNQYIIIYSSAAIMCPDLLVPINGKVTFLGDGLAPFILDTMAIYSCEPGYELSSTVTRTCVDLSDKTNPVGTWNGDAPTCSGGLIIIL